MSKLEVSTEDRLAIRDILLQYKAEGVEKPLLPMDVDLDGDGIVDAYGLDDNDNVIFVTGASLSDTVYVSDGDDHVGSE